MGISGVSNSLFTNDISLEKSKDRNAIAFKDILASVQKEKITAPLPMEGKGQKQWTVTALDGTVWTITDIGASLTEKDKAILSWPSSDQTIMTIAGYVAMERNEGSLVGDLNRDYLFGNVDKNIFGLIERFPVGELNKNSLDSLLRIF